MSDEEAIRELIAEHFPFIDEVRGSSGYLMYVESNVIVETLLALSNKPEPIPAYPVHDCLICKVSDEEAVISALHDSMHSTLGAVPVLDVEYSDGTPKIIEVDDHSKSVIINNCNQISNRIPEDDDPLF